MKHVDPQVVFDTPRKLGEGAGRFAKSLAIFGIVVLALALGLAAASQKGIASFTRHYVVAFAWWLSIGLGALFFVALQHLTSARWSVVVRRVAEIVAASMPVLGVLSLPILVPMLFGDASVYIWNDPTYVAQHELVAKKAVWLNAEFFVGRWVAYFAIWIWLAHRFLAQSAAQDASGELRFTERLRKLSAPSLILLAVSVTFAAFDLLMSLEPEWFSTIFGVYFFSGALLAFVAVLTLALLGLQRRGYLQGLVGVEHYHDLGKLLFAFTFFWGYIAFSQFMLIWYANIPEETVWFAHRGCRPFGEGLWGAVAMTLALGHLLIPFFGLMSRHAKRNVRVLAFWAAWLLLMHWFDLAWIVLPSFGGEETLSILDPACFLGVGGLCLAAMFARARNLALLPERDPDLGASLSFENH